MTTSTPNASFTFAPVNVTRGRKFRGFAYFLETYDSSFQLAGWNGAGGWIRGEKAKMWDPAAKRFVYANADFCENVEVPAEQLEADRKAYIDITIQSTIKWCASQKPGADDVEIKRFARNVLRKHHPEMIAFIDVECPDNRDVVAEVERTLRWAINLRTQPMRLYGKVCPGGKPYAPKRVVQIAFKALQKKGVTYLDGFNEAWTFMTQQLELPAGDVEL